MLARVAGLNKKKFLLPHFIYRNGAATPKQLWTAFESVLSANGFDLGANVTVTEFMKSWTEQAGYPLLTVTRENNSLVVVQV